MNKSVCKGLHAHSGLVVECQGVLYPAFSTRDGIRTPTFIPKDEIKNIFYIDYCFKFQEVLCSPLGTSSKIIPIVFSTNLDINTKPLFEKYNCRRYDQFYYTTDIDFDDFGEVYVHKRKFRDYGIYEDEIEVFNSYEELMSYVNRKFY